MVGKQPSDFLSERPKPDAGENGRIPWRWTTENAAVELSAVSTVWISVSYHILFKNIQNMFFPSSNTSLIDKIIWF